MALIRSDDAPAPADTPTARSGWRGLVLRLHFYAGILVGPFILIAAISGGLYAIAPTVERGVYADQLNAEQSGPARSLADQVSSAQAARPDLAVVKVRPAENADRTTRVMFDDPALGDDRQLAVFVDPASLHVQGQLPVYGSTEALPIRYWIDRLHVDLHLGALGRNYSELAASWMWVVGLGGLLLWWRRSRGSIRNVLTYRRREGAARNARVAKHAALGTWLLLGMVFLSATGLTWSKHAGDNIAQLRSELSWTTPALSPSLGSPAEQQPPPGGAAAVRSRAVAQIDSAVAAAAAAGVDGAVEVSIPQAPDTAVTVRQTRQPWRFGVNAAAVNPTTGQVISTLPFADWPAMAKLTELVINTHMGWQFGLLNQIALIVFAALLSVVIVRGYLLWWQRRPRQPRSAPHAVGRKGVAQPPRRGTWRNIEPTQSIPAILAVAFLGWFLPVLGISLLAFLLIDLTIGLANNGRASLRK